MGFHPLHPSIQCLLSFTFHVIPMSMMLIMSYMTRTLFYSPLEDVILKWKVSFSEDLLLCMDIFFIYILCRMCVLYPRKIEEGVEALRTVVREDC